ncbi:30S ribosomal protein S16 [Pilobolus umbonatus]|nr:30S ribosomal protein S16 [Pilobolus umbonatus]
MVVRIRLARHGRRNLPFYHIVVANARTGRNSKPIEKLGSFNPLPDADGTKLIQLNFERAKYWLTVGAQPSETVEKLFVKADLMPQAPKPWLEAAKKMREL